MKRWHTSLLAVALFVLTLSATLPARADFLIYTIRGTPLQVVMQGTATVNPGRTVSFRSPGSSNTLYFGLDSVEIKKAPTTLIEANRRIIRETSTKKPDAIYSAAVWALKKGQNRIFFDTVKKVLELDPKHEASRKIMALKARMDEDIPRSDDEDAALRKLVPRTGMKIEKSKHFILMHDTSDRKIEKGKTRAKLRLELLEQVYESFLLLFYAQDIDLDVPKQRLMVVLFNDQRDYLEFATSLSPSLSSAAGFWDPVRNISVFYENAGSPRFKALEGFKKDLSNQVDQALKVRGPDSAAIIRDAKAIDLLLEIARENEDIEVVSHETTHQMAGNTGLLPRHVRIPSWVHEGLATYFESPGDATWAGIGAVNELRLGYYRALEADREHSNIDFIVGDQIFDFAATHSGKLHGYGQAWALTHFLMETRIKDFVAFYRLLGELPPDVTISADLLTALFDKVFGKERDKLDGDWRQYMRTLKTDIEKMLEK